MSFYRRMKSLRLIQLFNSSQKAYSSMNKVVFIPAYSNISNMKDFKLLTLRLLLCLCTVVVATQCSLDRESAL